VSGALSIQQPRHYRRCLRHLCHRWRSLQPLHPQPSCTSTPDAPPIVHTSIGVLRVRVVVSNVFGTGCPYSWRRHIALRDRDSPSWGLRSLANVRRQPTSRDPAGAVFFSDPITFAVPRRPTWRSISTCPATQTFRRRSRCTTRPCRRTMYLRRALRGHESPAVAEITQSCSSLARRSHRPGIGRCDRRIGASITDGTPPQRRHKQPLAESPGERLLAQPTPMAVLNAGIAASGVGRRRISTGPQRTRAVRS